MRSTVATFASLSLFFADAYALGIPSAAALAVLPREDVVNYTTVTCSAPYINDADSKPYERWKAAGADHAWAELYLTGIINNGKDTSLKYSEYVSNFFHSKDSMICENMDDGPCSDVVTCDQAKIFSDTNFGFAKDSFNAAVSGSFTLGRDHAPKAEELQNELTGALGDFMEGWMKAELAFLNNLFSGSGAGYDMLTALTKNGLALPITKDLDLGKFVDEVQKIVYGKLVTIAWANLPTTPELIGNSMSDKDCVTTGDNLPSIISEDDAGKIAVCYEKKTFYVGYPEWKGAPRGGKLMDLKFTPLPGGTKDELSGGDKWKGLSLEDIVVSSLNGWYANGGQNGYKTPDFNTQAEANSQKLIGEDGVRTPGFLQLPMCTMGRLQVTTSKWQDDMMAGQLGAGKTPSLPCGTGAVMDSEKEAWGMQDGPTILE
ncbi:hypothetical protein K458DRAFT_468528 [Lentithecium fluviatile CBS 122367]|uniref:Uncharacterized protein n=1 Tax=Lentithecium fluviatile CBS 122367 TaxID=1168545 RepID=A0A6G1IE51_9PLEO|nr:hypothetical protein K458DRAFT_468528 [Lentithecium fluviatile CBS 122367]